jgi:hypothetical protein
MIGEALCLMLMSYSMLQSRRNLLGLVASAALYRPAQAKIVDVDLALVLAIDCSYSVSAEEYRLQMQGLGLSIMNPQVFEAIERGAQKKIAISAFLWSEDTNQHLIMPWMTVSTAKQAFAIGNHIIYTARNISPGGTSISSALLYAQKLLSTAPSALRHVVDVSTDGRNNSGVRVNTARDLLVNSGIEINGLAILNEVQTLDIYLKNNVTSGEGSFVVPAKNYESYAEAILQKLVKEIVGSGTS